MKRVFAILLVAVALVGVAALFTSTPASARATCAGVRCIPCPDGYHLRMVPPNCCQCVHN
ncbi:MAG: hypothetical protein LAO51_05845 [Acidobacteriia bacterium]|nr:hypothetical protein [Terriglobia bacterium]